MNITPQTLLLLAGIIGLLTVLLVVFGRRDKHPTPLSSQPTSEPPRPTDAAFKDLTEPEMSLTYTSKSLIDLRRNRSAPQSTAPRVDPHEVPGVDDTDLVFGPATRALSEMLPESRERAEASRQELLRAGYHGPHAQINYRAIRFLAASIPILLCGIAVLLSPAEYEIYGLLGLVLGPLVGWSVPRVYLQNRGDQRLNEIERSLPDLLDLLNACVSQGLSISDSMIRIGEELETVHPALSRELVITAEQARLGSLEHALIQMNNRIDLTDLHSFNSLLIQTERLGTSVTKTLKDYSSSLQTTLQHRADERSNKAAFKLLFPTVLCLMPAVYLVLLGPSIIAIDDFFSGEGPGSRTQIEQNIDAVEQFGF